LDENSLLSKGMALADIPRMHKALFVYGIGFNNFLSEISKGNPDIMKTVWKTYALMLEYCSNGNYQTAVAEIERDKNLKLA